MCSIRFYQLNKNHPFVLIRELLLASIALGVPGKYWVSRMDRAFGEQGGRILCKAYFWDLRNLTYCIIFSSLFLVPAPPCICMYFHNSALSMFCFFFFSLDFFTGSQWKHSAIANASGRLGKRSVGELLFDSHSLVIGENIGDKKKRQTYFKFQGCHVVGIFTKRFVFFDSIAETMNVPPDHIFGACLRPDDYGKYTNFLLKKQTTKSPPPPKSCS